MINHYELLVKVKNLIRIVYSYMFFDSDLDEIKKAYNKILTNDFESFINHVDLTKMQMDNLLDLIVIKDPSIKSKEEIILIHPGFFAIFSYRIAHYFYKLEEFLIAKIISELAHIKTGIDINAGAIIGDNFFIDHGTGIVIGETSIIGNNVIMFHGVTLGTNNIEKQNNLKRHPTIEDNVILYSNCTILGGDTIIGKGSIIGCNVVICKSILPNSIVKLNKNYDIFNK